MNRDKVQVLINERKQIREKGLESATRLLLSRQQYRPHWDS